jgi:hypothetical protein
MDTNSILAELKAERDRIDKAIAALQAIDTTIAGSLRHAERSAAEASSTTKAPQRARGPRKMSAAARKRISEAAKKRWAKRRKAKAS